MSYLHRLRCRVKNEGLLNTLKYCALVSYDEIAGSAQAAYYDLRYSGRLLGGNHVSAFKDQGANDVYHTDYSVLPQIFRQCEIKPDDVLVDVGCGKGRVINYWLSKHQGNKMFGVELDPQIAATTARQFARWSNVSIIDGDAVDNLPAAGTIFYFYNPFSLEKVQQFERKVAALPPRQRIVVIYYNPKSIDCFNNANWTVKYLNFEKNLGLPQWGRLNKYHDFAIITRRQPANQQEVLA